MNPLIRGGSGAGAWAVDVRIAIGAEPTEAQVPGTWKVPGDQTSAVPGPGA